MTKYFQCLSIRVRELPYYDDLTNVNMFLGEIEKYVPEAQIFHALDIALRSTPTRGWETHKGKLGNWEECTHMMRLRFENPNTIIEETYYGKGDPCKHLVRWTEELGSEPMLGWVHMFIHTLGNAPGN